MEGKNCRFLQGKKTEGAAVRMMTNAIRKASAARAPLPALPHSALTQEPHITAARSSCTPA